MSLLIDAAQYSQNTPLNLYLVLIDQDRPHRGIGGLQANLITFIKEVFQGCFATLGEPRCHHFAVLCNSLTTQYYCITICNHRVDHRGAADAKGEYVRWIVIADQ